MFYVGTTFICWLILRTSLFFFIVVIEHQTPFLCVAAIMFQLQKKEIFWFEN